MTWTAMVFGFLWRGYRDSHFNMETDNLLELGSTYEDVSQEIWRCFSGPVPTRGVIHGIFPIAPSRHSKGTSPCSTGKHETGFPWLYHPTNWQSPLLVPGAPKSIAWACTAGHASDGGRFCWRRMGSGQVSSMCWDGFTSKIAKLWRFRAWTFELYLGCCTLMFNTWIWDSSERHMADFVSSLHQWRA